ncbi:hypothetical protein HPB50_027870 [Hyalomma asiaticum]|nr:hypothetical protein HPB50_027870 [Hyalomma asiaticum]
MTWPVRMDCRIASRVGHSAAVTDRATQAPVPPPKRQFSLRVLLRKVACSKTRRVMEDIADTEERKHQFAKVAGSPSDIPGSIRLFGHWHASVNTVHQCQLCTTDFQCALLLLLLPEPVRCACLSQQATAEKDDNALCGTCPIKVRKLHECPLCPTDTIHHPDPLLQLRLPLLPKDRMPAGRLSKEATV